MNNNSGVRDIIYQTGNRIVYSLKTGLSAMFKFLPDIICIANPFVAIIITVIMFAVRGRFQLGIEISVPIILSFLSIGIRMVNDTIKGEYNGIPVAKRRYTKKDDKGNIQFNLNDIYEMAEYMGEIEEVLSANGMYKKKQ